MHERKLKEITKLFMRRSRNFDIFGRPRLDGDNTRSSWGGLFFGVEVCPERTENARMKNI
jgi:hypothetical protein